jgi:hypothetical protein
MTNAELANPKWMKQCAKTLHYTAEEKIENIFQKSIDRSNNLVNIRL